MKERIKQLRKLLHLTQTEFGERIGLTTTAISDIERGKAKTVTKSNIKLICSTFNVSEEWLCNGTGNTFNSINNNLSDLENEILFRLSIIDSEDRKSIENIINSLYKNAIRK